MTDCIIKGYINQNHYKFFDLDISASRKDIEKVRKEFQKRIAIGDIPEFIRNNMFVAVFLDFSYEDMVKPSENIADELEGFYLKFLSEYEEINSLEDLKNIIDSENSWRKFLKIYDLYFDPKVTNTMLDELRKDIINDLSCGYLFMKPPYDSMFNCTESAIVDKFTEYLENNKLKHDSECNFENFCKIFGTDNGGFDSELRIRIKSIKARINIMDKRIDLFGNYFSAHSKCTIDEEFIKNMFQEHHDEYIGFKEAINPYKEEHADFIKSFTFESTEYFETINDYARKLNELYVTIWNGLKFVFNNDVLNRLKFLVDSAIFFNTDEEFAQTLQNNLSLTNKQLEKYPLKEVSVSNTDTLSGDDPLGDDPWGDNPWAYDPWDDDELTVPHDLPFWEGE